MPWKKQVGIIASELSRAGRLREQGGGPEVLGCLHRARELLGVLESASPLPAHAGAALAEVARELSFRRLEEAPSRADALYARLMSLYRGETPRS